MSNIFYVLLLIVFVNSGRLIVIAIEKKFSILEYAQQPTLLVGATEKSRKLLKNIRKKIRVQGIVQGVGFRPFIFNLAVFHNLSGFVTNTSQGVQIEVEGESKNINTKIDTKNTTQPQFNNDSNSLIKLPESQKKIEL